MPGVVIESTEEHEKYEIEQVLCEEAHSHSQAGQHRVDRSRIVDCIKY